MDASHDNWWVVASNDNGWHLHHQPTEAVPVGVARVGLTAERLGSLREAPRWVGRTGGVARDARAPSLASPRMRRVG